MIGAGIELLNGPHFHSTLIRKNSSSCFNRSISKSYTRAQSSRAGGLLSGILTRAYTMASWLPPLKFTDPMAGPGKSPRRVPTTPTSKYAPGLFKLWLHRVPDPVSITSWPPDPRGAWGKNAPLMAWTDPLASRQPMSDQTRTDSCAFMIFLVNTNIAGLGLPRR